MEEEIWSGHTLQHSSKTTNARCESTAGAITALLSRIDVNPNNTHRL